MSLTPEQAIVGIICCVIVADGEISNREKDLLSIISVNNLKLREMPEGHFQEAMDVSIEGVVTVGPDKYIEICCQALPALYFPMAIALAAEFALLEGEGAENELRIVHKLRETLNPPDDVFMNILNTMCWRHGILE